MRQRGIARSLPGPAGAPLDEPFSALMLTAQTFHQVVDLLHDPAVATRTAVLVTHSVEEAAYMADRVVALQSNPGRLVQVVTVDVPRPRRWGASELVPFVDRLYALMT
jgi:NitT/TauT family transport system ATP-binding protein